MISPHIIGLILGLRPANERRRYFITTSLIGWAQAENQPCIICAIRTTPEHVAVSTRGNDTELVNVFPMNLYIVFVIPGEQLRQVCGYYERFCVVLLAI